MSASFDPKCRNAILYRTHFWDQACGREFAALQKSLGGDYDLIVTGFTGDADDPCLPPEIPRCWHNAASLQLLGYPGLAALQPPHLSMMRWFRDYPDYQYYWMIEYDVRYTGDWSALFEELGASEADLLATVVQSRAEHPDWPLWHSLDVGDSQITEPCRIKAFTPLMRLSRRALGVIDAAYRAGWTGHYEALWPTAIAAAGLSIEEIGGEGRFTPPGRYGRHYTNARFDPYLIPGSFVFRPSFLEHEIPPSPAGLWHPVKSAAMNAPLPPPPPPDWREHPRLRPVRRLRRWLRHYGVIAPTPGG